MCGVEGDEEGGGESCGRRRVGARSGWVGMGKGGCSQVAKLSGCSSAGRFAPHIQKLFLRRRSRWLQCYQSTPPSRPGALERRTMFHGSSPPLSAPLPPHRFTRFLPLPFPPLPGSAIPAHSPHFPRPRDPGALSERRPELCVTPGREI